GCRELVAKRPFHQTSRIIPNVFCVQQDIRAGRKTLAIVTHKRGFLYRQRRRSIEELSFKLTRIMDGGERAGCDAFASERAEHRGARGASSGGTQLRRKPARAHADLAVAQLFV